MKLLRQLIRQILLEGNVKETFNEKWYNVEEERSQADGHHSIEGSHHRENLKQLHHEDDHDEVDELFQNKRDLKRLWNEIIDEYNCRSFWEGPKMKYFHSLSYYGSPLSSSDKLSYSDDSDQEIQDLSGEGFFHLYDKTGNKDEMSTYGIYENKHQIPRQQMKFGVIISGRVTLATMGDAFTESRSKANEEDIARHVGSGMPKRIMPSDDFISTLLFEEDDIKEFGKIGECVIDNWSINAIVCSPRMKGYGLFAAAETLARQFGVPLLEPKDLGKKMK